MNTLEIGREQLNEKNELKEDNLVFNGHVKVASNLGQVKVRGKIEVGGGWGIKAGSGIVVFYAGIVAKFVDCLRVAVGFNTKRIETIEANVRKGDVILGKVVEK